MTLWVLVGLVVLAPSVYLLLLLWRAARTLVRMGPRWRAFYFAWLVTAIAAFVLPLVLMDHGTLVAQGVDKNCARLVKEDVIAGTPYNGLPFSIEVQRAVCDPSGAIPPSGSLVVRGPYGLEIASGHAGFESVTQPSTSGVARVFLLLLPGVFAVSLPFIVVLLRSHLRHLRFAPA